jgi:hypothetical protein
MRSTPTHKSAARKTASPMRDAGTSSLGATLLLDLGRLLSAAVCEIFAGVLPSVCTSQRQITVV